MNQEDFIRELTRLGVLLDRTWGKRREAEERMKHHLLKAEELYAHHLEEANNVRDHRDHFRHEVNRVVKDIEELVRQHNAEGTDGGIAERGADPGIPDEGPLRR